MFGLRSCLPCSNLDTCHATMVPSANKLSWLSSPENHVECYRIHPERHQLKVASLQIVLVGPKSQDYGVKPELAHRIAAELGAPDLAWDVFSLRTSANLRVCETYWSPKASTWNKH